MSISSPPLHLEPRDRAGLRWLRNRARELLTALKRRRKNLPPGEPYSKAEAAAIRALVALEDSSGALLTIAPEEEMYEGVPVRRLPPTGGSNPVRMRLKKVRGQRGRCS